MARHTIAMRKTLKKEHVSKNRDNMRGCLYFLHPGSMRGLTSHFRGDHTALVVRVQHHGACTETHVGALCVQTLSLHTARLLLTLINICRAGGERERGERGSKLESERDGDKYLKRCCWEFCRLSPILLLKCSPRARRTNVQPFTLVNLSN